MRGGGRAASVKLSFLIRLVEDSVDQVVDAAKGTPAALVAISTAFVSATGRDSVPVTDPHKDDGIWAVLDDGCNNNTHGARWSQNAQMKLNQEKVNKHWEHRRSRKCRGIGGEVSKFLATGYLFFNLPFSSRSLEITFLAYYILAKLKVVVCCCYLVKRKHLLA